MELKYDLLALEPEIQKFWASKKIYQKLKKLRAKGKTVPIGKEPPIWGFDGSSTNQAPGANSDCVLHPVFVCPDPVRGGDNKLVMAEIKKSTMPPDMPFVPGRMAFGGFRTIVQG